MNTGVAEMSTTEPVLGRVSAAATMELVVTAIDAPSRDIRTITFADPGGDALPGYIPGSHLIVPAGTCPKVPITSGWPAWPTNTMWRPAATSRSAWRCTLETSGQVASR